MADDNIKGALDAIAQDPLTWLIEILKAVKAGQKMSIDMQNFLHEHGLIEFLDENGNPTDSPNQDAPYRLTKKGEAVLAGMPYTP